ncbi:MAG TPA: C25 family cysteine peptidase, partial [Chitinophagales bacterium]|nr:C25 family cysteine peptidase [Chitinophagales bacterium]
MRKYLFLILSFIAFVNISIAQPYGHEWINTDLKHYRFKVIEEGFHRVYANSLIKAGIASSDIVGEHAKIIVNGEEIPLYVSTNGVFGKDDYIEFYGAPNDGSLDAQLYSNPEFQPNKHISLYTDSVIYYIAFDSIGERVRFRDIENKLEDLPAKEKFFYQRTVSNYTAAFRPGVNPNQLLNNVFNSEYDQGEGFSSNNFSGIRKWPFNLLTRSKYNGADAKLPKLRGSFHYRDQSNHEVLVYLGLDEVEVGKYYSNGSGLEFFEIEVPSDLIDIYARVKLSGGNEQTKYALYWLEIIYPQEYDFANTSKSAFAVHKKDAAYTEVSRVRNRGTDILVYDLKNHHRYKAIRDGSAVKIHFVETSEMKDSLYMTSEAPIDITQIEHIEEANFIDIEGGAEYVIITTKDLTQGPNGENYVEEYANYRRSMIGGAFKVKVYYIDELENTFSYGVKGHPISIRNLTNYLVDKADIKPEMLFILGKGLSYNKHRNTTRSFVPTYGHPASDNLLVGRSKDVPYPQVGVGRLSAREPSDIKIYLEKVRLYEDAQRYDSDDDQTLANKEWMKSILHLGGGNFLDEQKTFARYLESYKRTIEGASFGGNVHSVYKNSTDPVQVAQSAIIDSMLINGTSLVTFFGHSSTSTVDFDIEPENFKNPKGKYPLMFTNGCFIGDIFEDFNSYSERFVIAPDRAIGYLAPMTYAIAYSLNQYANNFYNRLGVTNYAQPIGDILKNTATDILSSSLQFDRFLGQQMIYHGDPAIKLNSFEKPDYIITEEQVSIFPEVVNASVDTFQLVINHKNIGRAIDTTYKVFVERKLPNGEVEVYEQIVDAPMYSDKVYFQIPTNNINGLGENSFYIKIDSDNDIDELSENNNEVNMSVYFTIDDLIPVFPFEYSITNQPNFELLYSTANPLISSKRYIVQIDTTENFNSPLLRTDVLTESGGVVRWRPSISEIGNTVYYWRGSLDTIYGNNISWNKSSFLYNTSLSEGWNQSHYFQFIPNIYDNMLLKNNREFSFIDNIRSIKVINGVDAVGYNDRVLFADNNLIARNAFARSGFLFYVLDTRTGVPMSTYQVGRTGLGEYGNTITSLLTDVKIIEFETVTQRGRYACYNFLKRIVPDQAIIVGYSFQNANYSLWAADDSTVFNGETLFDAFESLGVTDIRNINELDPFVFFTQKGNPNFATQQIVTDQSEKNEVEFIYTGTANKGRLQSPLIGPSMKWNTIDHHWESLDDPITDQVTVNLYGFSSEGLKEKLYDNMPKNADISFVDAEKYPYLQLEFDAKDEKNSTAPQLDYWRVIFDEVPEGAMNPKLHLVKNARDTIEYGGTFKTEIAFENISNVGMDSILVKFTVKDAHNNIEVFYKRFAALPVGEYIVIDFEYTFNRPSHQGANTIIIEANPDDDQIELSHFNNFAFFTIDIDKDVLNPLLDVTFDGRHITDGELVSPKPEILIKLKDENQFLALNDSLAFKLFLKTPSSTKPIPLEIGSNEFTFVPADETQLESKNEAKLYYRPEFLEDGI